MILLDPYFPGSVTLFLSQVFSQQESSKGQREPLQWCDDDDALQTAQKTDFQKKMAARSREGKGGKSVILEEKSMQKE